MPDLRRPPDDPADLYVAPGRLSGTVRVPQSKSIAHRAVICSALSRFAAEGGLTDAAYLLPEDAARADRIDTGDGTGLSADIAVTRQAMADLLRGHRTIFCGESGSTLRFLIPVAAALGRETVFTGAGRLPGRPLAEYGEILGSRGVRLGFPSGTGTYLPLEIRGRLEPGTFRVPGNVSSQYITGLLLALPLLGGDSRIEVTSEIESEGYIDLTIAVLKDFGVTVEREGRVFLVPGRQQYRDIDFTVEGDYSQAAFWLTAGYLGSDIAVEGLRPDSAQGDRRIGELLGRFRVRTAAAAGSGDPDTAGEGAIVIDASQIPDLVPILCVAAAFTPAVTRIVRAGRLRLKESDRIASTAALIRAIGGQAAETEDGIVVTGIDRRTARLKGGRADSFGDHRIAMAAAIAAAATEEGVTIRGWRCVDKSYPGFFRDLVKVKGEVYGIDFR